jgi:hypothetical protein
VVQFGIHRYQKGATLPKAVTAILAVALALLSGTVVFLFFPMQSSEDPHSINGQTMAFSSSRDLRLRDAETQSTGSTVATQSWPRQRGAKTNSATPIQKVRKLDGKAANLARVRGRIRLDALKKQRKAMKH